MWYYYFMKGIKNKWCSRCKKEDVPLIKYSKSYVNGKTYQYYHCRECNNKKARKYYKENSEKVRAIVYKSIEKHFIKQEARKKVSQALKKGKIKKPNKCTKCNINSKVQAHHINYKKPLFVEWLCSSCHANKHNKNMTNAKKIV